MRAISQEVCVDSVIYNMCSDITLPKSLHFPGANELNKYGMQLTVLLLAQVSMMAKNLSGEPW